MKRLPNGLVTSGEGDALGAAFDRLTSTLDHAGIQWAVYAIGSSGFAVASQLDSIRPDGTPRRSPARWSQSVQRHGRFSLSWIVRRLFKARPGRYRMIVFAVTDRSLVPGAASMGPGAASAFVHGSDVALPESMRSAVLGPGGRCTALIYEFFRPTEVDTATWVRDSPIKPVAHLVKSRLWTQKELQP